MMEPGNVYCMDALSLLRQLPDASVSLMATDPPFNIGKADWDSWPTVADYLDWLDAHLVEMRRVLKPNGSLYLFCATKYASKVEAVVEKHFNILNNIRWRKDNGWHKKAAEEDLRGYFPASESIVFAEQQSSDDRFADADYLLWGRVIDKLRFKLRSLTDNHRDAIVSIYATDGRYSTPASIRVNAGRQNGWLPTEFELMSEAVFNRINAVVRFEFAYADLRREYEDLRREYEDLRRPFYASADSPYTDVWEFATVNTYPGKHICEKPLEMMRHIVRVSSRPGDLVCDPFVGSGQTTRGAFIEGRQYIGGDADAKWAARADYYSKLPVQLELLQFIEMVG